MPRGNNATIDDWKDRLLEALDVRRAEAVRNNHLNQNTLNDAFRAIQASRLMIRIQKGGQRKGEVVGIPNDVPVSIV